MRYAELFLHPSVKSPLVMGYASFNVLLDSFASILLRGLASVLIRDISL